MSGEPGPYPGDARPGHHRAAERNDPRPARRGGWAEAPVFLDFRERLADEIHFEAGIHAVLFDPGFSRNRRVYLSYSQSNPRRNVLSVMRVPEDRFEEVNRVIAGGNYGWSERDGRERLLSRQDRPEAVPVTPYIDPVHSYSRLDGEGICIVGGFVYRGNRLPSLTGCYLFADWGVGKIWALHPPAAGATEGPRVDLLYSPAEAGFNPTLIVPDADGEILVLNHRGWIEEIYELSSP